MNSDQLLAFFERVSEAEDAIPRLRSFILDLAVRGKLVPQDSNDEPASELLIQIAAEKATRTGAGEAKVSRAFPVPAADHVPFSLPPSWRWTCLSEIGLLSPRNDAADNAKASFVPMTMIAAEYGVPHSHQVRPWGEIKKGYTHFAEGDVALAKITPCFENAKSTVFRNLAGGIGSGTTELHVVRPLLVSPDYILIYLKCPHFIEAGISRMTGTAGQKRLPFEYFGGSPFPLAPLAEQHRIVAKVDELMALCDQLEAARTEREATRSRLTTASLARLNAPDPNPVNFADHARFALNNLAALFRRPDQVKEFRQTILSLAVSGKLVHQDPDDESGSELLKRILRSRKGKQTIASLQPSDIEAELPSIPGNWGWAVADELRADQDNAITDGPFGAQLKTAHYVDSPGFRVIRLQNVGAGIFRDEHRSYIDGVQFQRLAKHHVAAGDLVVAGLVDPRVRCCQVPSGIGPALVKADCYRFAVHPMYSSRFALHYLNSPVAQEFAALHHHGMTLTRIGLGNFRRIPFPVPPLAEQHRIVAMVDQLMALCERLEASLTRGEESRSRLLDAVLHDALVPTLNKVA